MRRAPILLLATLCCATLPLAACKLVDQRTFDRTADRPPVIPKPAVVQAAASGPNALVTFPAAAPQSDWADVLHTAADLARSRKANVLFRVETVVPAHGDPQAQAAALGEALPAAREAADIIVNDGVDRSQIELAAVTDDGVRQPEIRIFVR